MRRARRTTTASPSCRGAKREWRERGGCHVGSWRQHSLAFDEIHRAGIGYIHLRPLGTPKAGRIANRAGRMDEFRRVYEASFQRPEAQLALLEAEELIRDQPTALLCFCGDHQKCHRHIIATALEKKGLKRREIGFDQPEAARR